MKAKTSEKGQALILIVFAIVGLIGMTALAVDGGNAYAERRRAQNAADATALDAALAKVRGGNLYSEGLARASSNNYVDTNYGAGSSSTDVNVEIYNPPTSGPYNGNGDYIQVIITATVKTYFGPVVGISSVTNKVQAVARATPSITSPMFFGNAIVSLDPHDCKAIKYQGNADTIVKYGGLYANSDCANSAFFNQSSSAQLEAPCLQAVGGITYKAGSLNIPSDCIKTGASTLPSIVYPNPTCSGNAVQNGTTLSPGTVGDFPPKDHGVTVENLEPGIYCVTGTFHMTGHDPLTGSNVVIVMETGAVRWEGGDINLTAPTSGPYAGLLLYMPESNHSVIVMNGNQGSNFTGTILAPSSDITLNGTGSSSGYSCQIIGYTVELTGNSDTYIEYIDNNNYDAPTNPTVELVQ